VSKADLIAGLLLASATVYAVFGGADFGAGMWRLLARYGDDPPRIRKRIERSLAPVWEANHTWLILVLVVLWTGYPEAFSAIFSTLYIPLALAALGIVLRGSAFAFGKVIEGGPERLAGALFSISSVLTPFFMGTVVGAIASGQVPPEGNGDPTGSWIGFLPLTIGALFVAAGAYIAAVFLTVDSSNTGEKLNTRHFSRSALGAALVAGGMAAVGLVALGSCDDAAEVWNGLGGPALPLVILSGVAGLGALVLLFRASRDATASLLGVRPLAVGAVVAVIAAWGVSQHPYLLPPPVSGAGLKIGQAAAPDGTLWAVLIVFGAALVIVVPALALLLSLAQRDRLE
jgi:cytochrome bd ubiquinol oxidase subunit II